MSSDPLKPAGSTGLCHGHDIHSLIYAIQINTGKCRVPQSCNSRFSTVWAMYGLQIFGSQPCVSASAPLNPSEKLSE